MAEKIRFVLRVATRAYFATPWALGADAMMLTALAVWALA